MRLDSLIRLAPKRGPKKELGGKKKAPLNCSSSRTKFLKAKQNTEFSPTQPFYKSYYSRVFATLKNIDRNSDQKQKTSE